MRSQVGVTMPALAASRHFKSELPLVSSLTFAMLECRGRGRGRGQDNLSVRRWDEMGIKNWLNKAGQLPFIGLALALISSTRIDGCLAPRCRLNGSPRFAFGSA